MQSGSIIYSKGSEFHITFHLINIPNEYFEIDVLNFIQWFDTMVLNYAISQLLVLRLFGILSFGNNGSLLKTIQYFYFSIILIYLQYNNLRQLIKSSYYWMGG